MATMAFSELKYSASDIDPGIKPCDHGICINPAGIVMEFFHVQDGVCASIGTWNMCMPHAGFYMDNLDRLEEKKRCMFNESQY